MSERLSASHALKNQRQSPVSPGEKPAWLKVRPPSYGQAEGTETITKTHGLNTVCAEAACPNRADCWGRKQASFLILGRSCTRVCPFCNVRLGRPTPVDPTEPMRLAEAVAALKLAHVVVTSVTRDDLPDGGAGQFAACITAIRAVNAGTTIEVLTPDFLGKPDALETVLAAGPDVFNHNMETVARLYERVRPRAVYRHSLDLLARAKKRQPAMATKSGVMVGLGESDQEIFELLADLRAVEVDFLTIGQYLQPSGSHMMVDRYVTPATFDAYAVRARAMGFSLVMSSPLTRSSHHADEGFSALRSAKLATSKATVNAR